MNRKINQMIKLNEEIAANIINLKDELIIKNDELTKTNEEINYYEEMAKCQPTEANDIVINYLKYID
jgi:hypothetical protein